MPRHPDPDLEQRILDAASRLWARGGEKGLTMRAVAKASGTTTPTVYERYRDRDDILRALRLQTRRELFAALSKTRTLREAFQAHLEFALDHSHAYEVLFDDVAKPPSVYEPWPSFNLMRERVAARSWSATSITCPRPRWCRNASRAFPRCPRPSRMSRRARSRRRSSLRSATPTSRTCA